MKVKSLSAVLALIAMFLVAQPPATAETVGPSGWWRNCALWGLTDKCAESIEYFADHSNEIATRGRDATTTATSTKSNRDKESCKDCLR